jgi:N-acetylmuramoyl-L-alanine amidase
MALKIKKVGCAPRNFMVGRPPNFEVEALVIHLIDGPQKSADATFLNPNLEKRVSAHYSISQKGVIHQYVDEADTAFHCGIIEKPTWPGLRRGPDGKAINPNFYTIGIEHEGRPDDPWSEAMYQASVDLILDITTRHPKLLPLTRRNVIRHREIRADKSCPGRQADLSRLIREAGGVVSSAPDVFRARSQVNVRRGQPSTQAEIVRVIPVGELVNVKESVVGETVSGIATWYKNMDDDFVWAGALAL